MSPREQAILTALGAPLDAGYYVLFDQSAHLDYDWIRTFDEYFLGIDPQWGNQAVKSIFDSALSLMTTTPGYLYSICEMDYLQKYVDYESGQGKNVVQQIQSVESQLAIIGGGITSPDNLLTSGEGFIRNYLLGKLWLSQDFSGLLPLEYCWIPDDFGHDPELPVTLQALGMIAVGFARIPGTLSTACTTVLSGQLYQGGVDFWWQASDGSQVLGHWLQGGYGQGSGIDGGMGAQQNIYCYLGSYNPTDPPCQAPKNCSGDPPYQGAKTRYLFVPMDNDFSLPVTDLLTDLQNWNSAPESQPGYASTGVWAVAGHFSDFVQLVYAAVGAGESSLATLRFNATPYWTGYYMSRPGLKIMHYAATRALLAAEVLGLISDAGNGTSSGFWSGVATAWADFAPSTHHDYVCGTASDTVYQSEQLPDLTTACNEATSCRSDALTAVAGTIDAQPNAGETPVVIVNPSGVPFIGVAELEAPVPAGTRGIRFGSSIGIVQPTYEGGVLFGVGCGGTGYTTGYLTSEEGSGTGTVTVTTPDDGVTWILENEYLSVEITGAAPYCWGIRSITDRTSGAQLLADDAVGNDLIFYTDGGDIYQFGNEYVDADQTAFTVDTSVGFTASGTGLGATVLETGPLRGRVSTVAETTGLSTTQQYRYTREYQLVSGEPFLRMITTGAAPDVQANPGYSIMTGFPFAAQAGSLVHGTPNHWTGQQPLAIWSAPVFQATHRFVLPISTGSDLMAAIYHPEVPAWSIDPNGVLLGCLLRNTPGGPHGASGSDVAVHTLHYALRVPSGLDGPATGQPLAEALSYTMPPLVAEIPGTSSATMPESYALAGVTSGTGFIMAAKPGDVAQGTTVLRLYQPTLGPQTLEVTLNAAPGAVIPVTALEDPIASGGPSITVTGNGFTIDMTTALATVQISW
jgi:alpha-mannosidase